jgi:hypothetical protein
MSMITWLRPRRLRSLWKLYRAAARAVGPLRAITDLPRTMRRIRRGMDAMTPAEHEQWNREHVHTGEDGRTYITSRGLAEFDPGKRA